MKKTFLGAVLLFFFAAVLMQAQNIAVHRKKRASR